MRKVKTEDEDDDEDDEEGRRKGCQHQGGLERKEAFDQKT